MMRKLILIILHVCALSLGAQTLTGRYVELADSADMLMRQERWQEAENTIVRALRHEPANRSNYLLWSNLGVVRTELQDYDRALEAFDIGLANAPRSTMLLANRARTLLIVGKLKEAMNDIDAALNIDSLLVWPRKMRAMLMLGDRKLSNAEKDLDVLLRIAPKDADVLSMLGDIKSARGDINGALDFYRQSMQLEKDEEVMFRYLLLLTEHGNAVEARRETQDAIKSNPAYWKYHLVRALQHKKDFQPEQSEKERKAALELGGDPAMILEILGQQKNR